jgi:hypothetical protein
MKETQWEDVGSWLEPPRPGKCRAFKFFNRLNEIPGKSFYVAPGFTFAGDDISDSFQNRKPSDRISRK